MSERRRHTRLGRAVVLAANGSRQGQHLLNVLLSGVDESIFNNVFAVGIRELQELATLNDTEAAELLYNLASGVDRVSLVEVMRDLEVERNTAVAHRRRSRAHQQAARAAGQAGRRSRRTGDPDAPLVRPGRRTHRRWSTKSLSSNNGSFNSSATRAPWRSRSRSATNGWHAAQIEQELGRVRRTSNRLPDGCVERLDQLNLQMLEQTERMKPFRQKRLEIRRQLAAQPINRVLWDECAASRRSANMARGSSRWTTKSSS